MAPEECLSMNLLEEDGMRQKTVTGGWGWGVGASFHVSNKHNRKKKTTEGIWFQTLKVRFLASQQPYVPNLPRFIQELVKTELNQES